MAGEIRLNVPGDEEGCQDDVESSASSLSRFSPSDKRGQLTPGFASCDSPRGFLEKEVTMLLKN
jgi:hypothetical protein